MQAGDNKSFDDINVTPMVDLYMVLLLIFIIMTTAGVQGVKVNLPKSGGPSKMDGPKLQAITVDNSGNIKLNAEATSISDLEAKLGAVKAKSPDSPVIIRGNTGTPYQTIMDVLDVAGRAGFSNIGLATKPKGK
jgi:biopolymer transport protein ExbD